MRSYSTTTNPGKNQFGAGNKKTLIAVFITIAIVYFLQFVAGRFFNTMAPSNLSSSTTEILSGNVTANSSTATIAFLKELWKAYPQSYTNNKDGIATVLLGKKSSYSFHTGTTYQKVVTDNNLIRVIIMHQLNDQGIEYQIEKATNNPDDKTGWIISWGGLLYLPKI